MTTQASYELLGNRQIELPSYMTMLAPTNEEVTGYFGPIIASGFQPGTKMVMILTVDGDFYELDAVTFFSTNNVGEQVYPIQNGQMLEFVRNDMIVTVDSGAILKAANQLQLTGLEIGMSHENQVINTSQDNQGRNGEKP